MKREGVGFQQALEILAGSAGLDRRDRRDGAGHGFIFCAAADYWAKCLAGSASARSYLERRGIGSPEIIVRYGIGFAPGRTRTRDWLLAKGFDLSEIESAGLVNRRGLDALFGRVTFPLVEDGRVVNVYGRSLSDRYKHMYLPARRDVIFNIEGIDGDCVILTESIIDTLSLVACGLENAVAALSAHLTKRQVEMLAVRFSNICVAFDGDDAGQSGAERTAAQLRAGGVKTTIARLPDGTDINALLVQGVARAELEHLFGMRPS
jgi:DNA primase